VLERLAVEFQRVAHPSTIAIGVAGQEAYSWPVVTTDRDEPSLNQCLDLAEQHLGEESDVRGWTCPGTQNHPPATALLFPIRGRSSTLGHVFIQGLRAQPLSSAVQRYLGLLTTHAGLVWENFQIVALRLEQQQMMQELRAARQIQTDLFPPTFEVDTRVSAFAVNLPSVQVSGDYYDLFMTGPDTLAFVIADAMGHGLPASLMMAAVRASLRMGVTHGLAWDVVFRGLDGIITQARFGGGFVTGILGEIDLKRNELRLVSAGHPPASILVDGRPVPFPTGCQTRPWGLNFDCPWEEARLSLGRDWSILAYTDGIIESAARSQAGSGFHTVAEYHQGHFPLNAEDLCQGLLSEVSAHNAGPLADDQTVLALRSQAAP
jgi:sigma-B regulation protein RsbU (phosphoserine phosphatase)